MPDIYDAMIRHQLFLEAVKEREARLSEDVIIGILNFYLDELEELDINSLDELSKGKLLLILKQLREIAVERYAFYTLEFLSFLEQLCGIETKMTASIIKNVSTQPLRNVPLKEFGTKYQAEVWANNSNAILAASGLTVTQYIDNFGKAYIGAIETEFKKGFANRLKTSEIKNGLLGEYKKLPNMKRKRQGGVGARYLNLAKATVETSIQHVSGFVQNKVQSLFFDEYIWLSILDGRTTDICLSRNRVVYKYGQGPITPAHTRCRSRTAPYAGNEPDQPKNLLDWLKLQPESFYRRVLPFEIAERISKGQDAGIDPNKFIPVRELDLKQYRETLGAIIA